MSSICCVQELLSIHGHGRPCNEPKDPVEVMGMLRVMAAAIREQAATVHRMME